MSENTITLTPAAEKIVASDVRAFKADKKRYADYIAEMGVKTETVAEHVAMFRNAYKAATKNATGDEVKAYATKVRNGLNYHLGKAEKASEAGVLRVSLSGEGGGSTVVPNDHPLYADICALLAGE